MMLTFWRRYHVDCLICIFSGTVKVSAVPRREVDLVNGICTSGGKKRVATLGLMAWIFTVEPVTVQPQHLVRS